MRARAPVAMMMCSASISGRRLACLACYGDTPSPFQSCCAVDHRDVILAHEIGDAVRKLIGHFAAPRDHAGQIEADIIGGEPELGGATHRTVKL